MIDRLTILSSNVMTASMDRNPMTNTTVLKKSGRAATPNSELPTEFDQVNVIIAASSYAIRRPNSLFFHTLDLKGSSIEYAATVPRLKNRLSLNKLALSKVE